MIKPNFQEMTGKDLRSYMLAHRDDDEAFYAYMDKVYESIVATESAVVEWLKFQNQEQIITQQPERNSRVILEDPQGNKRLVKIQLLKSALPRYQALISLMIEDLIQEDRSGFSGCIMVAVGKNEVEAMQLDRELMEIDFESRTHYSQVVGYINAEGKFQRIAKEI